MQHVAGVRGVWRRYGVDDGVHNQGLTGRGASIADALGWTHRGGGHGPAPATRSGVVVTAIGVRGSSDRRQAPSLAPYRMLRAEAAARRADGPPLPLACFRQGCEPGSAGSPDGWVDQGW
ncbi:hypothetical protein GCM10010430_75930 [Kitasatospora cystarginea]|uniref:Uncharacterized protein n=1 Tax=Kitasatospora cystarginea TaxID=58350 RepID=A0ABN3EZF0_9ACTN